MPRSLPGVLDSDAVFDPSPVYWIAPARAMACKALLAPRRSRDHHEIPTASPPNATLSATLSASLSATFSATLSATLSASLSASLSAKARHAARPTVGRCMCGRYRPGGDGVSRFELEEELFAIRGMRHVCQLESNQRATSWSHSPPTRVPYVVSPPRFPSGPRCLDGH